MVLSQKTGLKFFTKIHNHITFLLETKLQHNFDGVTECNQKTLNFFSLIFLKKVQVAYFHTSGGIAGTVVLNICKMLF